MDYIKNTLRALHAVHVVQAETHTAIFKGLASSLMTSGAPPSSIDFSCIIRCLKLLHGAPPNSQKVYILTIEGN